MFKRYRFILALMICVCVFSCGVVGTACATEFTKGTDCSETFFNALKAATGGTDDNKVTIDVTNIKGLKFEDGKITAYMSSGTSPFTVITGVPVTSITDLTGINNFTALQSLDVTGCTNTSFTTLDVIGLTALKSLDVTGTSLTTLKYHCNTNVKGYDLKVYAKQLILNGSLNMAYYVAMGSDELAENVTRTARFKIGSEETIDGTFDQEECIKGNIDTDGKFVEDSNGDKNIYAFIGEVTSIQMADPISTDITVGTKSVTFTGYTVKQYFTDLNANSGTNLEKLVNAIKAYGYYAQQILKETPGNSYGNHENMDDPSTAITVETTERDTYSTHAMKILDEAGINEVTTNPPSVSCTLDLDSKTTLHVYLPGGSSLRDANNKTGINTISTQNGTYAINDTNVKTATTTIASTQYFDIAFSYIAAQELADKFTIPVTINSTNYTIQVSAMSYVHSVISKSNEQLNTAAGLNDTDTTNYPIATHLKQAVTALYNYGEATKDYRSETNQ